MAPLTDELSIILKDGLRGARFVVRHGAKMGREAVGVPSLVPRLAELAESIVSKTEKAARALLPKDEERDLSSAAIRAIFTGLGAGGSTADFDIGFLRLHYGLLELVFERLGVTNLFISAHEIMRASVSFRRRHRRLLQQLGRTPNSPELQLRFWVTSICCLAERRVVRHFDAPTLDLVEGDLLRDKPYELALLSVAIVGALMTRPDGFQMAQGAYQPEVEEAVFVDSAIQVIVARFDRLCSKLRAPNASALLYQEIEPLLSLLP